MSYSWSSINAMENQSLLKTPFWFGNSMASHCSIFLCGTIGVTSEVKDHFCKTEDKGLIGSTQHPHTQWVYSGLYSIEYCGKQWMMKYTKVVCFGMLEMCKHKCILVCFCAFHWVSQASCPSGIHNKASCLTLWGSGRGSTMATIWALCGPALWSGAAELGKLEQWSRSGHQKKLWVPAAARAHNGKQQCGFLKRQVYQKKWAIRLITQCGLSSTISPAPLKLL